jgi:hypothetical protein
LEEKLSTYGEIQQDSAMPGPNPSATDIDIDFLKLGPVECRMPHVRTPDRFAFTTSFGFEDQGVLDRCVESAIAVGVFTRPPRAGARITGLPADQSAARSTPSLGAYHPVDHLLKANPRYQRGLPSIGCVPGTRAVAAGEDACSGRWLLEEDQTPARSLHIVDGHLVRAGA